MANKKRTTKNNRSAKQAPPEQTPLVQQPPSIHDLFRTACVMIGEQSVIGRHQAEMQAAEQYQAALEQTQPEVETQPPAEDETPHLEAVSAEG